MKSGKLFSAVIAWGLVGILVSASPTEPQGSPQHPEDPPLDHLDALLQSLDELNSCTADLLQYDYALAICRGRCGNNVADAQEECDGQDLRSHTCGSVTGGARPHGILVCSRDCRWDTSWCTAQRFVDNGNGTITDNLTGLMWEQKSGERGPRLLQRGKIPRFRTGKNPCLETIHAIDSACTWFQTVEWIARINARRFAGYNDWRLPTVQELVTILDYERMDPSVSPIFSPTQAASYWSSTSVALSAADAWGVDFSNGRVFSGNKQLTAYVRAVRRGP